MQLPQATSVHVSSLLPKRSEIGRVATALNRMLGENEAAFAQRECNRGTGSGGPRRCLTRIAHTAHVDSRYAELFRVAPASARRPRKGDAGDEDEAARSRGSSRTCPPGAAGRRTSLERKPVALDDLAERAIEAARAAEPDRLIPVRVCRAAARDPGDENRLRQVVDNLLANVRRHTPSTLLRNVSLRAAGDEVILTVEDTGPGIRDRRPELVFGRFARPRRCARREHGGVGLGLRSSLDRPPRHGGAISVRSAKPHGRDLRVRSPSTRFWATPS